VGTGYQPFALGVAGKRMSIAGTAMRTDEKSNSLAMALTDKEIDERVCFLVHFAISQ
jgi:hypothetical protein